MVTAGTAGGEAPAAPSRLVIVSVVASWGPGGLSWHGSVIETTRPGAEPAWVCPHQHLLVEEAVRCAVERLEHGDNSAGSREAPPDLIPSVIISAVMTETPDGQVWDGSVIVAARPSEGASASCKDGHDSAELAIACMLRHMGSRRGTWLN